MPSGAFYGGGRIDGRWGFMGPIGYALGAASDAPLWGTGYKNFVRKLQPHDDVPVLPDFPAARNQRHYADPDVKDAWGLPAMRITYKDHPDGMKLSNTF